MSFLLVYSIACWLHKCKMKNGNWFSFTFTQLLIWCHTIGFFPSNWSYTLVWQIHWQQHKFCMWHSLHSSQQPTKPRAKLIVFVILFILFFKFNSWEESNQCFWVQCDLMDPNSHNLYASIMGMHSSSLGMFVWEHSLVELVGLLHNFLGLL